MLKNSHEKLKKFILIYFYAFELQFIPKRDSWLIDKGKLAIIPVMLGLGSFLTARHLLFQLNSLNNVLEFCYNVNVTFAGTQTIITVVQLNMISRERLFQVLQYFDDIVTSEEEFLAPARKEHLNKGLTTAWKLVRAFLIVINFGCIPLLSTALVQTNFTSPVYYTIPGISSDSVFYYPVNIIGQIVLFYITVECVISMDCLLLIYLFYFRGEIYSITSVAELLNEKSVMKTQSNKIIKTIYKAHREALKNFTILRDVFWHTYCHKFFTMTLYICIHLFIFTRVSNSIIIGILLQFFVLTMLIVLCLPGQLVDNCSKKLRKSLYMTLWYEMKIENQKNLLMVMIGAQRNIQAETFGIGKISIYTLVQICKTAISYAAFAYAVLL